MHGILRTIDKLDKQGPQNVRSLLVCENGLTEERAGRIMDFIGITGDNEERLSRAAELLSDSERAQQGLSELRSVLELAQAGGVPPDRLRVDLSIARGLDYYTGTVFETILKDLPQVGSVMSGGRYDDLISTFTGRDMPAVGISVGLDRLLAALQELGKVDAAAAAADVFVTVFDEGGRADATALAARLRDAGLSVQVSYTSGKLGKQFKQADRLGARVAVVRGPDERANDSATVKDLGTGNQKTLPLDDVAPAIEDILKKAPQ